LTSSRRRAFAFAAALLSTGLACELPQNTTGEIDPTVLAQAVVRAQNATIVAGLTETAALPPVTETPPEAPASQTSAPDAAVTSSAAPTPVWNWAGSWMVWMGGPTPK